MEYINVRIFADDDYALSDALTVVTRADGYKNASIWNFNSTYFTDLDVHKGDLVIVPVHRSTGENQVRVAIVTEVLTDAKAEDFEFTVREVLFKLDPNAAIKSTIKRRQNQEIMKKMEKRAQKLDAMERMKKYAETDPEMKKLMDQFQANQQEINNTPLIEEDGHICNDDDIQERGF